MISKYSFLEEEIPYEKLEKLGISRDAFLSMPKNLVDPIINGRVSPIIEARIKAKNGKTIAIPMKIQLSRDDDGSVKLLTYQRTKEIQNDYCLTPRELNRVKNGEVIRKELEENGIRIAEKLKDMEKINHIELGANQKQQAQEGKPIELNVGDQKVVVGVDLREQQGFKVVNGDMDEWNRQMKIKYDLEHDDYMGYVQTDENRWEYQKCVNEQSKKDNVKNTVKKEEKNSSGLKL